VVLGRGAPQRLDQPHRRVGADLLGDRHGLGLRHLLGGDVPLLLHGDEAGVAPPVGLLGVLGRLGQRRGPDDAGQEGRLAGVGDLPHVDAEVGLAGGGDAVGAPAEEDRVEVALEDLLLRHLLLELDAEDRLLDLPADRALGRQVEGDLHVLLGDGRAALRDPAALDVLVEGAGDAHGVDAVVLEEVPVLHGDDRLDDDVGHLVERHVGAVLVGLHPGHGVAGVALAGRHVGRADVGRLLEVVELGQLGLGEDDPHAGDAGQHGQPDQEQRAAPAPEDAALATPVAGAATPVAVAPARAATSGAAATRPATATAAPTGAARRPAARCAGGPAEGAAARPAGTGGAGRPATAGRGLGAGAPPGGATPGRRGCAVVEELVERGALGARARAIGTR